MKVSLTITRRPNPLINIGKVRAALDRCLTDSADLVAIDLEKPTKTWKTKIKAAIKKMAMGRIISIDNAIYGYVSKGTKPHIIRAKRAKYLAFGSAYGPKTTVNSLDSSSGSRGPVDTFRKEVRHPGSKARNFDKIAADNARKVFPKRVAQAIKEGVK